MLRSARMVTMTLWSIVLKALLKSTNPVRTAVVHIVLIQVTMNEVPHENKVMLYRTP